jgi:hypothetical protein
VTQQTELVFVPLPAALYSEFILRKGEHVSVATYIEDIVSDYLNRTRGDEDVWSPEHAREVNEEAAAASAHGDPGKGYHWQTLFLPNGTQVRMLYQGQNHYAVISHEKLLYAGESLSPSELASYVAKGTNRNAWRDLWLQLPRTRDWIQADVLRKLQADAARKSGVRS